MAENRRGKDRRYYFTLGQMVLLGTAFTLTALVIFFLGIFIGKGIEARKMIKPEEPLIKIPVKPSAQGSAGTAGGPPKEELTFYDTLTKSPQVRPTVEEKVKEGKAPGKALKREVKETRPEPKNDPAARKAIEKDLDKGVSPVAEATKGTKEPEKSVKPELKDSKTEAKANGAAGTQKVAEKGEKATPSAEVAKATPAPENAEQKEVGKTWSVQLNAFPDERSAKQLVDRLKNKGYNAVISEARNKGKVWYRVRVGKYSSREEADKALESFKTRENFEKAFATSRQ
jgi:cell division septation protein DedD